MKNEDLIAKSTAAALSFMFYDHLLTFDDEVNVIWSKPNFVWIKWHFLFIRYGCFCVQLTELCIQLLIVERNPSMIHTPIRYWFISQACLAMVLLTSVEAVLMLRVYAMYNQKRSIGLVFITLICGKMGCTVAGVYLYVPSHDVLSCELLEKTLEVFIFIGAASVVTQLVVFILMCLRCFSAADPIPKKTPMVWMMIRDGMLAPIILFVVCALMTITILLKSRYGPHCDIWVLSVASSSGSRIILNLQQAATNDDESQILPSDPLFTTQLTGMMQAPHTTIHQYSQYTMPSTVENSRLHHRKSTTLVDAGVDKAIDPTSIA